MKTCMTVLLMTFFVVYVQGVRNNVINENGGENAAADDSSMTEERCDAIAYKQNITVDGCRTKMIDNSYCKGQCISGYVPENGVNGKYRCSSCQPHVTEMKNVELSCENGKKKIVQVEIFKECKCTRTECHISNYSFMGPDTKLVVKKTAPGDRPCRDICRKCRRARRIFRDLRNEKDLTEYLLKACRLPECKKRISKNIFNRTRKQKKIKKADCHECHRCKDNKRKRKNQK